MTPVIAPTRRAVPIPAPMNRGHQSVAHGSAWGSIVARVIARALAVGLLASVTAWTAAPSRAHACTPAKGTTYCANPALELGLPAAAAAVPLLLTVPSLAVMNNDRLNKRPVNNGAAVTAMVGGTLLIVPVIMDLALMGKAISDGQTGLAVIDGAFAVGFGVLAGFAIDIATDALNESIRAREAVEEPASPSDNPGDAPANAPESLPDSPLDNPSGAPAGGVSYREAPRSPTATAPPPATVSIVPLVAPQQQGLALVVAGW